MMGISSVTTADLDQAVFFIYPDAEALKNEFASLNFKTNEKDFMQNRLKALWIDIKKSFEDLAKSYFWHDEGIHWEIMDKLGSSFNNFICGKIRFGDGMEDEWFVVKLLLVISAADSSLVISVFDSDGDFILIEAAEVLPHWLEPENSKNRIFIHDGKIKIVPIEKFPNEPTLQEALKFIRQSRVKADREEIEIFRVIQAKMLEIGENQKLHHAKVRFPLRIAQILYENEKLIGPAISSFYHREPESMGKCLLKMSRFNPNKSGGPLVSTTIPMTRIQFAQLACQEFIFPSNEEVDFDLMACENFIAAELGMKITCGFEILMSSKGNGNGNDEKFISKNLFENLKSVQSEIEELLKNFNFESSNVEIEKFINDRPEDGLEWMELDEKTLNLNLNQKFEHLSMDETEQNELITTWTREFENGTEKINEIKGEIGEIDLIIEKMKKMISSSSNFEGISIESENESESESENDSENDNGNDNENNNGNDSENDENLIQREIFETINFDPDLLMKILEVNAHQGVSSEDFLQKFQKYQAENPATKKQEFSLPPRKGLADIARDKVEEARRSCRKVFGDDVDDDETDTEDNEIYNDNDNYNDNPNNNDNDKYNFEESDEFIYGKTLEQFKRSSTCEITPSDDESYEEYCEAMNRELASELCRDSSGIHPGQSNDDFEIHTNLAKNFIESVAATPSHSRTPLETVLAGLGHAIPTPKS